MKKFSKSIVLGFVILFFGASVSIGLCANEEKMLINCKNNPLF